MGAYSGGGGQLWRLDLIRLVKFSGLDSLPLVNAEVLASLPLDRRRSHTERMKHRAAGPRVVHLQPFCLDACGVTACVSARVSLCASKV